MAARFPRHAEAFTGSSAKGQKRPRVKLEDHLQFIRTLPCLVTGRRPVEAAHIRYADMRLGKRGTGMGEKPDDQWVVPLSPEAHRDQHQHDEMAWWRSKGIDPVVVALALWKASGDEEVACEIIRRTRS
jgi:hypothetical protein